MKIEAISKGEKKEKFTWKSFLKSFYSKKDPESSQDYACHIVISCQHPKDNGDMQVEMTYEGDVNLARCLVDRAASFLAEKSSEEALDDVL